MTYHENDKLFQLYVESVNTQQIDQEKQQKLADFIVDLVVKIEQGDQQALKLLELSQEELIDHIEQSQQTPIQVEAFENIRSKVGGFMNKTNPVENRYKMFLTTVNKKIWELGEDINSTNDENNINSYQNLINQLAAIEPDIIPKAGNLQQKMYNVGKGVSKVGKVVGSIAGAGLVMSALSSIGLPAFTIGAVIGGGMRVLKNASNTNMSVEEKLKKALLGAGLGAVLGYAIGELREALGGDTGNEGQETNTQEVASTNVDINNFFTDESRLISTISDYMNESGYGPVDNVRIQGDYVVFDTPQGESYLDIGSMQAEVKQTISMNRPPINNLVGYIVNTIKQ